MREKVALITGGASGIGLATARRFMKEGFSVCVADLNLSKDARNIVKKSRGIAFEVDVRDGKKAREIISEISQWLGRLDALVTCAGLSSIQKDNWKDVLDVDLTGTFNYIQAASSIFRKQCSGRIVTIAATLALRARRNSSSYVAAKAGVIGLTRAIARDLGRYNVNVNCVAPGLVDTNLANRIPDNVCKRLIKETCLGRIAQPDNVASVIWFLCTDDARHITGEVIRVDGGQLA